MNTSFQIIANNYKGNTNGVVPAIVDKKDNSTPSFNGTPKTFTVNSERLEKIIEGAGGLSSPANRFFLGVTALLIQPRIDWGNKNVDEPTRMVSCARTMAKIIAGTLTGVIIRAGCIKFIDTLTDIKANPKTDKLKTALIPDNISIEQFKNAERLLKKHRQALGTIMALFVMLGTNFALDVPITEFLTNFFTNKFEKAGQKRSKEERVN